MSEDTGEHIWIVWHEMNCCQKCGIIKRADGKNKPCPGIVRIGLREKDGPQ